MRVSLKDGLKKIKDDLNNLQNCIKSTYVSTRGNFTKKFENKLSQVVNSKYVVAVSNGTVALDLAY